MLFLDVGVDENSKKREHPVIQIILVAIGNSEGDAVHISTEKSHYQKMSPRAHLIQQKRLLLFEQTLETSE